MEETSSSKGPESSQGRRYNDAVLEATGPVRSDIHRKEFSRKVGGARRWVLNGGPLPVLGPTVPPVRLMVIIPSSIASNNRVIGGLEKDGLRAHPTRDDAATPEDHVQIANEQLATLKREVDGLKVALASRTVIGIALGIIIEHEHVTEPEAFQILKKMSQHTNVKLRDIAAQMAREAQRSS